MNVLTIDLEAPHAQKEFIQSLRETGFAVLKNHSIPKALMHQALKDWSDFFLMPETSKLEHLFNPELQAGFFPYRTENAKDSAYKDLKEFYHHYPWHPLPKNTHNSTRELFGVMMTLGRKLLGFIEEASPKNPSRKSFVEMLGDDRECLLRSIHYPAFKGNEEKGAIRAAAHEDINLITLLIAATEPGLEVRDLDGNWHAVQCDPDTIAVNAGDMLQLATNRHFISTTHRVINPNSSASASKPRFSMPLFIHATKNARLNSEITTGEYLDQRLREIGLKKS